MLMRKILFLLLVLILLAFGTLAQAQTSTLSGKVTDETGAVIPQATVAVVGADGKQKTATADGVGSFQIQSLAPGAYTVVAGAKGFATLTKSGVVLAPGHALNLNLTLQIQAQEEKVEVHGEEGRPELSVGSASNASALVIKGKDLEALSDDPDELQSELQALAGPAAGPNGGQIYIDGFTGGQLPPKSAIREIRINQDPFSAEYDKLGYGRIEILTKPGSDKFHGQFFFNDSNSFLDALNPFAAAEPDFNTEMTSGNIGGPISKNASYQINAERRDINDAAVILPAAFSAANVPVEPLLNPRVRTSFTSRLDYQLASSNTLMVRYQFTHNREANDGIGQLTLPSQAFNQTLTENTIQISDTQVLSPQVVNETRFEWQRGTTDQNSLSLTPAIAVLGQFNSGGNPAGISDVLTTHYELQNYTSINKGNHFMRLGGRLRATAESNNSTLGFNGI